MYCRQTINFKKCARNQQLLKSEILRRIECIEHHVEGVGFRINIDFQGSPHPLQEVYL